MNSSVGSSWYAFDERKTLGQEGAEGGIIIKDEEHGGGARITMEQSNFIPYIITCSIYGWMHHVRTYSTEIEANIDFEDMKAEMEKIIHLIADGDDAVISQSVSDFMHRYM